MVIMAKCLLDYFIARPVFKVTVPLISVHKRSMPSSKVKPFRMDDAISALV